MRTSRLSLICLDRVADAEAAIQRAAEAKLESPDLLLLRYFIALLKGDTRGMRREVAQAAGKQGVEDVMSHAEALILARAGRLQTARRTVTASRWIWRSRPAARNGRPCSKPRPRCGKRSSGMRRRPDGARRLPSSARRAGRGVCRRLRAGAVGGVVRVSCALADDLEKRFPEDTSVRFSYVPTLRALLALNGGSPDGY